MRSEEGEDEEAPIRLWERGERLTRATNLRIRISLAWDCQPRFALDCVTQ
jgi:hypothetical protein